MKRTTRRLLAVVIGLGLGVAVLLPQGSAQATSIGGLGTIVINSGAAACANGRVNAYIVSPTQVGTVRYDAFTDVAASFNAATFGLPAYTQSGSSFLDTLLVFTNTGAACTISIQVRNAAGTSLLNTCGVTLNAGAAATPTTTQLSILNGC